MNRGDVWLAQAAGKPRPVLVLTRDDVIAVRDLVTVAELTTQVRGLAVEVPVDHDAIGLDRPCVVNADSLQTLRRRALTSFIGVVDDDVLTEVCDAVATAIACG